MLTSGVYHNSGAMLMREAASSRNGGGIAAASVSDTATSPHVDEGRSNGGGAEVSRVNTLEESKRDAVRVAGASNSTMEGASHLLTHDTRTESLTPSGRRNEALLAAPVFGLGKTSSSSAAEAVATAAAPAFELAAASTVSMEQEAEKASRAAGASRAGRDRDTTVKQISMLAVENNRFSNDSEAPLRTATASPAGTKVLSLLVRKYKY
jgi:hypothetical protein